MSTLCFHTQCQPNTLPYEQLPKNYQITTKTSLNYLLFILFFTKSYEEFVFTTEASVFIWNHSAYYYLNKTSKTRFEFIKVEQKYILQWPTISHLPPELFVLHNLSRFSYFFYKFQIVLDQTINEVCLVYTIGRF